MPVPYKGARHRINIRLPLDLYHRAAVEANRRQIPLNDLINEAIAKHLENK